MYHGGERRNFHGGLTEKLSPFFHAKKQEVSQQSSPSQAQAKRMRELDEKKLLNGDVIDGIMMEDKKEVDKVILTGAELSKYFGKETTPREMKDQIIKLLDDWKGSAEGT